MRRTAKETPRKTDNQTLPAVRLKNSDVPETFAETLLLRQD